LRLQTSGRVGWECQASRKPGPDFLQACTSKAASRPDRPGQAHASCASFARRYVSQSRQRAVGRSAPAAGCEHSTAASRRHAQPGVAAITICRAACFLRLRLGIGMLCRHETRCAGARPTYSHRHRRARQGGMAIPAPGAESGLQAEAPSWGEGLPGTPVPSAVWDAATGARCHGSDGLRWFCGSERKRLRCQVPLPGRS